LSGERTQDQIGTLARSLRVIIHRSNVKERLKSVMTMLAKLRHISHEPQHALPDIFIWLLQNNKRVAYHRLPAKLLIYSPNDEEAGKDCSTVQTLFLKVRTSIARETRQVSAVADGPARPSHASCPKQQLTLGVINRSSTVAGVVNFVRPTTVQLSRRAFSSVELS